MRLCGVRTVLIAIGIQVSMANTNVIAWRIVAADLAKWIFVPTEKGRPMDDLISRHIIKEQMFKYGFTAPDMTVTEFVEDCLPSAQTEQRGLSGWLCPVCGRGLSPFTSVCPCNNGKGWEITC